ncbi:hypothetical protein F5Y05DRAFT_33620 [Hypoxylon sp. FL0543]|nr:hypothetical protein F5Y05DRAFT_33620 [Hypoxylon sp. FL0543]
MAHRESQSSDEERLLPRDGSSLLNPNCAASRKISENTNSSEAPITNHPVRPFRRFWRRTLTLLVIPFGITAYYFVIWLRFKRNPDDPVKYGSAIEIWIFYSWFAIGVFGLEWSKYGLVGVESAMLQASFWKAPNAVALMMHSESSWSGPDGWLNLQKRLNHRLWYLLAFLSLLAYVAFPLSGLSFETADGYVPLMTHPLVIGHTWEDFNRRQKKFYDSGAWKGWEIGSPATVPGFGVIYTPGYLHREDYSSFKRVPNTLPLAEGIPEIFLAPQAEAPVSGKAWGIHAGYNCSMVKDASEFTILGQKSLSSFYGSQDASSDDDQLAWVRLKTPSEQLIYAFSSSSNAGDAINLWGYAEMGVSNTSTTTYDGTEPGSFNDSGIAKADILEFSLWQARLHGAYGDNDAEFNSTLDPVVRGMGQPITQAPNGSFVRNDSFFKIQSIKGYGDHYNISTDPPGTVMTLAPAIGIRCRVVSNLGAAELDPVQTTFHSFTQTSSPPFNSSREEEETPRLGNIAQNTMLGRYIQIFTASSSPAPITVSNSYLYQSYIQPHMLQRSIMLAYAMDALQLMYDGTYGFEGAWSHTNLTSSKPGKVLVSGRIPQGIIAGFFATWAFGCMLLGISYGFRRRWSDSLDGYSFFRFGVELADKVKDKPDFWAAREFYHSTTLESLPGLIGDMQRNGRYDHRSIELSNIGRRRKLATSQ